jgi:hypothetical protein
LVSIGVQFCAAIAHHLAGTADVGEVLGELQQRQLAVCYLFDRGHVDLPIGLDGLANSS